MVYREIHVSIRLVPQLQLDLHILQQVHVIHTKQDVLLIITWMDVWIYQQLVLVDKNKKTV